MRKLLRPCMDTSKKATSNITQYIFESNKLQKNVENVQAKKASTINPHLGVAAV